MEICLEGAGFSADNTGRDAVAEKEKPGRGRLIAISLRGNRPAGGRFLNRIINDVYVIRRRTHITFIRGKKVIFFFEIHLISSMIFFFSE